VAAVPDATLGELRVWLWSAHQVKVGNTCLSKRLRHLGLTLKKSPRALPKGKASAPYESSVKVSIVTTKAHAPGGQIALRAKALPGNPDDGHSVRAFIEETQKLIGRDIQRAYVGKGCRGHDAPQPRSVFIAGQKRGVIGVIKRELRRRSAIERVIGPMKSAGHLGGGSFKGRIGDAANAVLTAVGDNFRLILAD